VGGVSSQAPDTAQSSPQAFRVLVAAVIVHLRIPMKADGCSD
jgi:hypothetical protein